MCGITGIISKNKVEQTLLKAMTDSMTHRGPDEDGFYLHENIGLGMRRLSIIDVSNGHQPFYNEDKSIIVVANGEIYNHQEIRQELRAKGHHIETNSDIEIIPHLYEEEGSAFIERLEGMFGIALLDLKKKKLFLLRDRMGVKPLFYSLTEKNFVFSSDINSILKSGAVAVKGNPRAVYSYFNYRFGAAGNDTFFENVYTMFPSEIVEFDCTNFQYTTRLYTDYFSLNTTTHTLSEEETILEAERLLTASVKKRLMSDVPLGTLLSSGIDSTMITTIASRISNSPVESFTVGYDGGKVNEIAGAEETCKYLGIKNNSITITQDQFTKSVEDAVHYSEAPITHPNSVSVYHITNFARSKGFKVLLSGEGSDEIFGGYFRSVNLYNALQKWAPLPEFVVQLLQMIKPESLNLQMILLLRNRKYYEFVCRYFRVTEINVLKDLNLYGRFELPFVRKIADQLDDKKIIESILQMEQRTYLQELLLRQDKMSMMSSIEVRVPLVEDPELVRFVNSIPASLKIMPGYNKYILRKVAEKYLPKDICYRPKIGFSSPITYWLRKGGVFNEFTRDTIQGSEFTATQKAAMFKLIDDHVSEAADNNELIWKIINYITWKKLYKV
ncbi:MAG: hypothetical protein JWO06_1076 [Bacteroidota bacterium]|nr:hypothetical protein [Bacteroidota bacterium]